jgi:hypothetical protein
VGEEGAPSPQDVYYIHLHIVKDVVVVKLFPSIHPYHHPSMHGITQGRKPWQK